VLAAAAVGVATVVWLAVRGMSADDTLDSLA